MKETVLFSTAFLLTYIGVGLLRRWILSREILDIPNERSSHTKPTPRGAGLVIVCVSLGLYLLGYAFEATADFHWSFFAGALGIALVSWLDDLFAINFGWRFLIHALAAILVISDLGFWREVYIPFYGGAYLGAFGAFLTFCWIVWLTNAFNFMDGIDGIAGLQAVTAGIGWLVAGKILGFGDAAVFGAILAFSSLGFLIHNWQPAKIFMGDVGSAFLGYCFAVLPLFAETGASNRNILPLVAVLLVFCFVFDSVATFLKRLFRGEKVWEAHREHIYQRMFIGGYSHRKVTLIYGFISALINAALIFYLSFQ